MIAESVIAAALPFDKNDVTITVNLLLAWRIVRHLSRMELKVDTMWREFLKRFPGEAHGEAK